MTVVYLARWEDSEPDCRRWTYVAAREGVAIASNPPFWPELPGCAQMLGEGDDEARVIEAAKAAYPDWTELRWGDPRGTSWPIAMRDDPVDAQLDHAADRREEHGT